MSYDWKKTLISPDDSIGKALKIIDAQALRIAIVVDENLKLLGIITDGDVRRAILKDLSLETKVSSVMNREPVTLDDASSRDEAQKLMKEHNLLSIPKVKNGILVGLESFYDPNEIKAYDNPVFIMAGGLGSRLSPLTDNCPKPLLKVGDKPLLEIILNNFMSNGFVNFYISTHYLPKMIRDYFGDGSKWKINIEYVHEENPLGTAGALGLLPKDVSDLPMIFMNGDILTNVNLEKLLRFHNKEKPAATMCVREHEVKVPYGVVYGKSNQVTGMEEKPINRYFVNAGIYVLSPNVFKNVKPNSHLDMPTLLQKHINLGNNVKMFPIHEYWLDIGQASDYKKAQQDIKLLSLT